MHKLFDRKIYQQNRGVLHVKQATFHDLGSKEGDAKYCNHVVHPL